MTLQAIKRAIRELPERKKSSLLSWLRRQDAKAWDKQIAEDFSEGGRGSQLIESWDAEIKVGDSVPLSEFLAQRGRARKKK